MMSNKIIIGEDRKKDKKKTKQALYVTDMSQTTAAGAEPEIVEIPVDENVWGNDYTIINKLDEIQLANRRLYVRVRYVQRIECRAIFNNMEDEPVLLAQPIVFIISDISMGGIGIICEEEISIGKILSIPMMLDHIPYEIKCEVVYCFQNDGKFRAGLKIVHKDKQFIKHLKIVVARISLTSAYGSVQ